MWKKFSFALSAQNKPYKTNLKNPFRSTYSHNAPYTAFLGQKIGSFVWIILLKRYSYAHKKGYFTIGDNGGAFTAT